MEFKSETCCEIHVFDLELFTMFFFSISASRKSYVSDQTIQSNGV